MSMLQIAGQSTRSPISSGRSFAVPFTRTVRPHRSGATQRMQVSKAMTIWVKGNPETQTLGDCPFCHRSLLTLELKGLEYTKEYVDFANKPAFLFEHSEKGTVPVLKDGDKWVPDSGDICSYLEDTYPPTLRDCIIPGVGEKLFPKFVQYLKSSKEDSPGFSPELAEQLQQIEDYLGKSGGPFLGGETMCAYDALVVPRLYHISITLPHYKKHDAFEPADMEHKFPRVAAYLKAAKATEAFKKTDYGADMVLAGWASHFA